MRERLGSRWKDFPTTTGVLRGWELTFNVRGFPLLGEPAFASIAKCDHNDPRPSMHGSYSDPSFVRRRSNVLSQGDDMISPVCGVIYQMDRDAFDHLAITEGVGIMYDIVEVDVESLCSKPTGPDGSSGTIKCAVFVAKKFDDEEIQTELQSATPSERSTSVSTSASSKAGSAGGSKKKKATLEHDEPHICSKRYRDLLVNGSKKSSLPNWYCKKLERKIRYVDYGTVINAVNRVLVYVLFLYFRLCAKASRIYSITIQKISNFRTKDDQEEAHESNDVKGKEEGVRPAPTPLPEVPSRRHSEADPNANNNSKKKRRTRDSYRRNTQKRTP